MKYAVFDENGFPKAFYDKAIHGNNIPAEAVEITDEQWLEFINNQGRRRWDFEKKQVVEYSLPIEELERIKKEREIREMIEAKKREILERLAKEELIKEGKIKKEFFKNV